MFDIEKRNRLEKLLADKGFHKGVGFVDSRTWEGESNTGAKMKVLFHLDLEMVAVSFDGAKYEGGSEGMLWSYGRLYDTINGMK